MAEQLKANKFNEWAPLEGGGDFRSPECIELLKQADIVVTNPPFSLFREYIKQLIENKKNFVIVGNMNAITYKEIFPLIKNNKIWLGNGFNAGNAFFSTPDARKYTEGVFSPETGLVKFRNCCWFTNIEHGRRHQKLSLMSKSENIKFNKKLRDIGYIKYENYNAIEVPYVDAIPNDYKGAMGVPISFLEKYCPEQFEILGTSDNGLVDEELKRTQGLSKKFVQDYYKSGGTGTYTEGNPTAGYYLNDVPKLAYKRIFIKRIQIK